MVLSKKHGTNYLPYTYNKVATRAKMAPQKRSPPTNHVKFTQCVNGLVSIMLPSVSQPLLYISFCKKQCHKESYCGGHRFSGTQNTFAL